MKARHRVVIAEDHTILRAGLRSLLDAERDFEVIAEVDNGKDAVRTATQLQPDLMIMDLSMPHMNGAEAIRDIKRRCPGVRIVVLTVHKADEYIRATLAAAADGFVLKDDTSAELMGALRTVAAGRSYLSPQICQRVVSGYLGQATEGADGKPWDILTHREREVLKLIAEGYRNKDIAAYFCLSAKTVEKHRSNLMRKLDLHNTSALTAYAIENGLLS